MGMGRVHRGSDYALGCAVGYGCRAGVWFRILLGVAALIIVVFTLFSLQLVGVFCGTVVAAVAMVPMLIGVGIGTLLRIQLKDSRFEQRWYLPMLGLGAAVALLGVLDHLTHRPYAIESIVTAVDIPGKPVGKAWNAVMF